MESDTFELFTYGINIVSCCNKTSVFSKTTKQ